MSDISTTDPTTGRRPGVRGARRHAHPGLVLLVIAGAQLMVVLDGTIVNIALPSMGRYFDKSQTDMTWALNAYTLAFGGLLLLGGRSGDIFGRRKMFIIGLSLFTLGSFCPGFGTRFGKILCTISACWFRFSPPASRPQKIHQSISFCVWFPNTGPA